MTNKNEINLTVSNNSDMLLVAGEADENIRLLQQSFRARITTRGNVISIAGDEAEVQMLASILMDIIRRVQQGDALGPDDIRRSIELARSEEMAPASLRDDVILTFRGQSIRPKTSGQKHYVDAIRKNTITFGIGPAGTGKTYLAMALAVSALRRQEVGRIILSRPIVEAGENLGFLPGTLTEKVDPYIRPLYDALFSMTDAERASAMLENGTIEIAPLAFMRGRTLNDSFIILDEAQNTTPEQMKMMLTRIGFGSKMVITGDITQSDINANASGLKQVKAILGNIDDIAFCELSGADVVRNSLVREIIAAYEEFGSNKTAKDLKDAKDSRDSRDSRDARDVASSSQEGNDAGDDA